MICIDLSLLALLSLTTAGIGLGYLAGWYARRPPDPRPPDPRPVPPERPRPDPGPVPGLVASGPGWWNPLTGERRAYESETEPEPKPDDPTAEEVIAMSRAWARRHMTEADMTGAPDPRC